MNSFVKSLIQPLLEQEGQNIALVPGGFKPPTIGHFALVNEVSKNPNIDKVIVLIGHKNRDGVSKEESKEVWDIYKKYLPSNIEIQISENPSPISDVASLIKNNPQNTYYPVVGIRGEMDLGDLKRFDSLEGKYPNFKTIVIKSEQGDDRVSGTNTRAALIGGEKERFQSYLPTQLSSEEKNKVWSILTKTPLDEVMYAEPSEFSYPPLIKSLTEYMLDKGMNIRPLPKVKFVDNDAENAQNFFGKTAYYDPNNRVIVLYTMNRHPKDVMRSYAHEMIHHMQNCDGRLQNITTQNTNEEGDLPEIEKEAYEKGNMTFRNWTDNINSNKYLNEYKQYVLTELFEKDLPNIEKISPTEYIVGNGDDIEALYYFKLASLDPNDWEIHWKFTENNKNESPEAWKQVTATSYKILKHFIDGKTPKSIEISGNTDKKTKIYKSKSYLEKLENIFNNQYKIDNSNQYVIYLNKIEEICKSGIKKRMETLNESYEQSLYYWQNGDINSKSKIERWDSIKKKIKREVLYEIYNLNFNNSVKIDKDSTKDILKEDETDDALSYPSTFKSDTNILVVFKNNENYPNLKPLFDEHGYGFYYPKDKTIILNGEDFVGTDLDFNDMKFVEAHEIAHLLLGHTGPYSEDDEMDADLGAYLLLKSKGLSTDKLVKEFENRHGVPFTEDLLQRVDSMNSLNENIDSEYVIYCDMDGVLCDFDLGYEKLTGISTAEANTKGKSYFWELFRKGVGKNEKEFWANLPWQPGGQELWKAISPYTPNILSSPAIDFNLPSNQQLDPEYNQAIQGKKEWIAKNLSNVGEEIFVPAVQKATFAAPNHILIDDMKKNTDAWEAAGGIAISHKNLSDTLRRLETLKLYNV
jgi:phosphopantetheine adenylyltransferase